MKTHLVRASFASVVFAGALLGFAGCQSASQTPRGKVVVEFTEPDKFTDLRSRAYEDTDEGYVKDLRAFLERNASYYITPEQTLTVNFTDVDMAGDYEPGRLASRDVRLVKAIYPARLVFNYKITDATGAVIKEGQEKLRDDLGVNRIGIGREDPLFFEKELLKDWMRVTLKS